MARDRRLVEEAGLGGRYDVHYADAGAGDGPFDARSYLEQMIDVPADGVVGTHDNSVLLAALLAERRGLPGPTPAAVLSCQYKPACRARLSAAVPEAVPRYAVFDGTNAFQPPFFVKPALARNSLGARRIDDLAQLATLDGSDFARQLSPVTELAGVAPSESCRCLMEELLTGDEVTLEGYVFDGRWTTIGITDSFKYPGTASFEHFDYPTSLPAWRQEELSGLAQRVVAALGFDGGMLNIELFVPEGGPPKVTEVNPRVASQYAPLVQALHGRSTYDAAFDLACGTDPRWRSSTPADAAVSYCVRTFVDGLVERVPRPEDGLEVLVRPGLRLSEQGQNDSFSYRLALLVEVAGSREEALGRCRRRAESLDFVVR